MKNRNYGIDLLKIVAMVMVVVLHTMGNGGVLKATETLSPNYVCGWLLETICFCAVNCYALISGYVSTDSRFKYSSIISVWLQALIIGVSCSFFVALISDQVYLDSVFKSFLPLSNNGYWYLKAYVGMCFFAPIINIAFQHFNKSQLSAVGIGIASVVTIIPAISGKDIFYTKQGYSAIWLIVLYIIGGVLKKNNVTEKIKTIWLWLMMISGIGITFAEKMLVQYLNSTQDAELKIRLMSYTSPTMLIAAVALFMLFAKIKTNNLSNKIIAFFAPLTFGVYLIHENPSIKKLFMTNMFSAFADFNPILMILSVLGTAIAIFLICALIDFVRDRLFKLLQVKNLLIRLETKIFGEIWS